jgi:hypothetical protein
MIQDCLKDYSNVPCKVGRLVRDGKYHRVIRGLYETDPNTPGEFLAQAIYSPSYLSFDFALARYGLIPETVFSFTSATVRKRRTKEYSTAFGTFTYRDVPEKAFPYGLRYIDTDRGGYWIAGPEKALCDKVYSLHPVHSVKSMRTLLFEDLRIDEDSFFETDAALIDDLSGRYGSTNVRLLRKVREGDQ